jgi:hypothetical protein
MVAEVVQYLATGHDARVPERTDARCASLSQTTPSPLRGVRQTWCASSCTAVSTPCSLPTPLPSISQAITACTTLHECGGTRRRVRTVDLSGGVSSRAAQQWIADGLMDEHVAMPFTLMQVLAFIERNASAVADG